MSIKTWKAEFYPYSAHLCTRENAAEHSLQKWRGLSKENLEKHGCVFVFGAVVDISYLKNEPMFPRHSLGIDSDSCGLCKIYYQYDSRDKKTTPEQACDTCPLKLANGHGCNDLGSEWKLFWQDNSPEAMIEALEKTVVWLKNGAGDAGQD